MKLKTLLILCLLLGIAPQATFAQQSADSTLCDTTIKAKPMIADEVVALVGNTAVLYSDVQHMATEIENKRKMYGTLNQRSAKEEALEVLLKRHLLATCAQLDSLDKNMMPVDAKVEDTIAVRAKAAGGILALEKEAGKPIYQIRSDLTIEMKQQELSKIMEQTINSKVDIEYTEVREFADTIPDDQKTMLPVQYSFSQIVRLPEETEERKYAIRERLLEYRKRILDGETNLGVLAQLYSADLGSARHRGQMGPQPIGTFVAPFAEAAEALKPGEISGIVETEYGFHLIELVSKEKAPSGELMVCVRHILLKPEFTLEESRQAAAQLDSIATEIRAGRLDFAEAALKYSDDKVTKQNGGRAFNQVGFSRTGDIRATSSQFVAEEIPTDYRYIQPLKVGEISAPYETMDISTGDMVQKIVRLDAIIPAHKANLVEDYDLYSALAQNAKRKRALNEWIGKNISRVYIEILPEYWDYSFEHKEWIEAARRTADKQNVSAPYPTLSDIDRAIEEYNVKLKEQQRLAELEAAEAAREAREGGKTKKK